MISERDIKTLVKTKLQDDPDRFLHVIGVVRHAEDLARVTHNDEVKARIAAWCHDATKRMDRTEEIQQITGAYPDIRLSDWPEPTRHALTGAIFAETVCGVNDPEILNAIRYHATGRPAMGVIEKILFVADFIEESRTFLTASQRELPRKNLDLAFRSFLEMKVAYFHQEGMVIAKLTEDALNYYRK